MSPKTIYLDNAATTWPKPESVYQTMDNFLRQTGANPGRSGHRMSVDAARIIFEAREELAEFFGLDNSERVIFTANATHSINLALKGLLKPGDEVVISSMEHNSVIRPLRFLEKKIGIKVSVVKVNEIKEAITKSTRLAAMLHASNVTGQIMPIREVGAVCKKLGVFFLVDAAQTAGVVPIDMERYNIDLLAFTGHKALFGPQGIGGLCLGKRVELEPLLQGGTGSRSEFDIHPEFLPDRLEAGTLNGVGIVGLKAGVEFIKEKSLDSIQQHEKLLARNLIKGLRSINGVTIYASKTEERIGVVSFNIGGKLPSEVGERLDKDHGIMVRVGLHCSPLVHKTIGTFPHGTVRASLSGLNKEEDIEALIEAVRQLV